MFNKIIIVLFIFSVTVFAGEVTKKYDHKDFQKVNVGWGMKVDISQSNSYSIEVNADEKDFEYLKVEKDGDELKFYIDKNNYNREDEINIKITMPALTEIDLSGGSVGKLNMDVSSKNFDCDLSGGSILKGSLKCAEVELDLSGGSQLTMEGKCENAEINGSGGAIFHLKEFAVKNAEVSLSGGSQVSINMNGTLNASQSGGSQITYFGNANIGNTSFSGGSGISKGD